jgi:peptidoglycan-associated lipoprotein
MKKLIISMAALAIFAGCASKDVKEQPPAGVEERGVIVGEKPEVSKPPPPVVKPQPEPVAKPVIQPPIVANPLTDPGNILSKRSVFFDYDSTVIKDEFKPLVTAHAQYLVRNRSARMVIQGNTDERGSREYNIALGQRRADSVKQMMILLGAQEAQIESVSYGEEKPRASGKDESAFAQNRRGDIVYAGE